MTSLKLLLTALHISVLLNGLAVANPLFPNSVVSNDIDFIHSDDVTVASHIIYVGTARKEMADKRNDILFDDNAYVFILNFDDGTSVEVYGHSDFENQSVVENYVSMLSGPIGKLPFQMRDALLHVVIHKGDETAFAEHLGQFFAIYSENMETRAKNHDLEETVFHETVHATLDHRHRTTAKWTNAQQADNEFFTNYAARTPNSEDLAESALFAYTLIHHPGRLPVEIEHWMVKNIPNRLSYFKELFNEKE